MDNLCNLTQNLACSGTARLLARKRKSTLRQLLSPAPMFQGQPEVVDEAGLKQQYTELDDGAF